MVNKFCDEIFRNFANCLHVVAEHLSTLFIRFAIFSYGRFVGVRYEFKLSNEIQEWFVRRGWVAAVNGGEQSSEGQSSKTCVSDVVDSMAILTP
jgi:hypothetical protein